VSTIKDIEAAIERLPAADRDLFEARVIARRFGFDALESNEYRELLASLDDAEREIDAGRGMSAGDLRQKLAGWAGK
jgi:hypothetical protein